MTRIPNQLIAAALALLFNSAAFAAQGLITDQTYVSPSGYQYKVVKTAFCRGTPDAVATHEVTCDTKKGIQAGLKATTVFLGIASAACVATPLPVPAKAFLLGTGALVGVVDLLLLNLPCEDKDDKRKQAEQFCAMLRSQGFACDINAIRVEDL